MTGLSLKLQVESALHPLIGLPLWKTDRAASMQMFQFGAQHPTMTRRGKPALIGDYGLHVQCAWRIVGLKGIVVGSLDLYSPAGDADEAPLDFEWDKHGANRRDERLQALFASHSGVVSGHHAPHSGTSLVVNTVQGDDIGGVMLTLSGDYSLELWPHDSLSGEHWRLLINISGESRHFVITGRGVED